MPNCPNTIEDRIRLDPQKPMFSISVIAKILETSQKILRIYDKENLLTATRSAKNRRLYSFNDIEKGKFIQYLRKTLGINIIGIKIILYLLSVIDASPTDYYELCKIE